MAVGQAPARAVTTCRGLGRANPDSDDHANYCSTHPRPGLGRRKLHALKRGMVNQGGSGIPLSHAGHLAPRSASLRDLGEQQSVPKDRQRFGELLATRRTEAERPTPELPFHNFALLVCE
jgi:hypothetical protein